MNNQEWELLGHAAVDSGQLLLIDPAYINSRWEMRDFEDVRAYQHKETLDTLQFRVDFGMYTDPIESYDGKSMNELIDTGEWEKMPYQPDNGALSYNTVSHTTLTPARGGQVGLGVAFSTGWGDGNYPVHVKRNTEGRIMQVLINFNDEGYDE